MKSNKELLQESAIYTSKIREELADVMGGFNSLAQAATKDGALDKKIKELIALAIGIAVKCEGCIGYHSKALVKLGATKQEVLKVLGMTIYMGGGPSLMYAAQALKAFEEFSSNC